MKKLCKECSYRESCTELCAEVKEYVNADTAPSIREFLGVNVENFSSQVDLGTMKSDFTLIYELYFLDKKSVSEIIYHVFLSRRRVYEIIQNLKNNIKKIDNIKDVTIEKTILKLHFIDGKDQLSISKELHISHPKVYDTIKKYLASQRTGKYVRKSL